MSTIHFKRNKRIYRPLIATSLIGVSLSAQAYWNEFPTASLFVMILLSLLTLFFAVTLFNTLRRFILKTPALSVSNEGLIDSVSLANAGSVSWSEIKSIKVEKYLNSEQILIALHKPQDVLNQLGYLKKKMVIQQWKDTGAVIIIDPKMIKAKSKDLVAELNSRKSKSKIINEL